MSDKRLGGHSLCAVNGRCVRVGGISLGLTTKIHRAVTGARRPKAMEKSICTVSPIDRRSFFDIVQVQVEYSLRFAQ
jgi:hypothetical protein